jgi:lipopolysaccharide biosynthesis regulator YciM
MMSPDANTAQLFDMGDRLTTVQQQQSVFLSILETLVAAVAAQTEMLSEILAASQQEPRPSETADALAELALAVQENTSAVHDMNEQLTTLPEAIATELATVLGEAPHPPG